MDSPDSAPSGHLTPVKGACSPDHPPSEIITPVEYHYPTPPDSKRKTKIPPGNLRVNTQITMSEGTWGKGLQRTIMKSEDSLSVQERRVLKAHAIITDAQNNPELDLIDNVQIWKAHVRSLSQAELVVAMNPFYDEYADGDYYAWLNDTYYGGEMPEIVRRANAFRGFPQLDEDLTNPQGWEEKHAHYRSPGGVREMEPYQTFIQREKALLDPQLSEYDRLAQEEATRESIEASQKTWANTLGLSGEPTSAILMTSSAEASPATPKTLWSDSLNMTSSKTSASPAPKTEPTSVCPATTPVSTAAKPGGSHASRLKRAPADESAAKHTTGGSGNGSKKKRRRRRRNDSAYKPGRDASGDESDDDMPRKRHKKSRM